MNSSDVQMEYQTAAYATMQTKILEYRQATGQ